MKRRLTGFIRDLTGRAERDLVSALDRQVDAALRGAEMARKALEDEMPAAELRGTMGRIENEGDAGRGELVDVLSRAVTTPVDREDLFRLSRSIDDVLDHLQDFARELDLYEVKDRRSFLPLIDALVNGLANLRIAVLSIVDDPGQTSRLCLAAKKAGNKVRRMYQAEVATLFAGEFVMDALKQRELLRRLDIAGLLLCDATDVLADGAMKRSQ